MSLRWTKDERFVVCAYEAAMKKGQFDAVVDRYEVGKAAGITAKAVNAILNLLVQANFVKKLGPTDMKLTRNGEALAERLIHEAK